MLIVIPHQSHRFTSGLFTSSNLTQSTWSKIKVWKILLNKNSLWGKSQRFKFFTQAAGQLNTPRSSSQTLTFHASPHFMPVKKPRCIAMLYSRLLPRQKKTYLAPIKQNHTKRIKPKQKQARTTPTQCLLHKHQTLHRLYWRLERRVHLSCKQRPIDPPVTTTPSLCEEENSNWTAVNLWLFLYIPRQRTICTMQNIHFNIISHN